MAAYNIIPDKVQMSKRELSTINLIKSSENYYDYDSIELIDESVIKMLKVSFIVMIAGFQLNLC